MTLKLDGWIRKTIGTTSMLRQALSIISKPSVNLNSSYSPEMLNWGINWQIFVPCDLGIWWITLKNYRTPFLCYFKLCASFHSHRSIQTWVTVRKRSIQVKICNFFVMYDLEIWWMTLKNNKHLFYMTSNFVHHIIAISQFKLELQSGNAQFRSKLGIFWSHVTLKFDGSPWKTIGHLLYATSSFVHHFATIGELIPKLQSGNAQFGWKYVIFFLVWPWNLMDDLKKLKSTSPVLLQALCIIS